MTDKPIDDIDIDRAKANLLNSSSVKLADMVVCYRYLGLYKEVSMAAMEELSKRRSSGDGFDFEEHIDKQLATLPNLKLQTRDMGAFFKTVQRIVEKSK